MGDGGEGGGKGAEAAIAHLVLACAAGAPLSDIHFKNYSVPGFHTNLLVHGIIGFCNFQGIGEIAQIYKISKSASKCLPIPCLMADLTWGDDVMSTLHVLSGLAPFALACTGSEDKKLEQIVLMVNIGALCWWSHKRHAEWGWYTAGAAAVAYLASPNIAGMGPTVVYPLALSVMEYCGWRIFSWGGRTTTTI